MANVMTVRCVECDVRSPGVDNFELREILAKWALRHTRDDHFGREGERYVLEPMPAAETSH